MATHTYDRELLAGDVLSRLESELSGALKRRPAQEAKLAGAVRVLAEFSPKLRQTLLAALEVMVRRASFERPLFTACITALAATRESGMAVHLAAALNSESAGGLSTLCAACFSNDPKLSAPLAKLATSRHAHLAFAADIARIARGESKGEASASVAPKIKESHRIELCIGLLVPLLWQRPQGLALGNALAVFREAERHLGRWLVLAEVSTRAGDTAPLKEAREHAKTGPTSARAGWGFLAWALDPRAETPTLRPTLELVARLSDRPSADRDPTFLFRLASAAAPGARPILETLAKQPLGDESAVRAALHLARDYSESRYRAALVATVDSSRRSELRGLASAAVFDVGDRDHALDKAQSLIEGRSLAGLAWGSLILARKTQPSDMPLVDEPTVRRLQFGSLE